MLEMLNLNLGQHPMTAPNRPWFRFSLRTLFIVVTVFCCWLGWQANIVRERKLLLQSLIDDSRLSFDPLHTSFGPGNTAIEFEGSITFNRNPPSVPWGRRMLGDNAVAILGLPSEMDKHEVARFKSTFPEATLTQMPTGMNYHRPGHSPPPATQD